MHFTTSVLALGSMAGLANAAIKRGFVFPDSVPIEKRQTSGPAYQCHANCGYTILNADEDGYCDDKEWQQLLEDCLACATEYDLWPDYGEGVEAAAKGCGLTAVPDGAEGSDDSESSSAAAAPSSTKAPAQSSAAAPSSSAPESTKEAAPESSEAASEVEDSPEPTASVDASTEVEDSPEPTATVSASTKADEVEPTPVDDATNVVTPTPAPTDDEDGSSNTTPTPSASETDSFSGAGKGVVSSMVAAGAVVLAVAANFM